MGASSSSRSTGRRCATPSTGATARQLAAAFDRLDTDSALGAAVLTGAGGGFSASMDLRAFLDSDMPFVEGDHLHLGGERMHHHSSMSADNNWLLLAPDLLRHVAEQLSPRLPSGRTLLANGATLLVTSGNGQRVLVSETMDLPPIEDRASMASAAERILGDVQDVVAYHLMTSWPVDPEGRAGHPVATIDADELDMGFRRSDGEVVLSMEPYPLPSESPGVIVSG